MNIKARSDTASVFSHRTRGRRHGPINRLMSPGDLGRTLKPFVFLDAVDIQADTPLNFDWHPHSGIATATVVFDGESWAEESNRSQHSVPAGGVEWVRAGGGVWHRGGVKAGGLRGFQLWLALDEEQELLPASAQYIRPEQLPTDGPVRVVLGEFRGHRSPVPSPPGVSYLQVSLDAGQQLTLPPRPDDVAFLAPLRGALDVHVGGGRESLEGPELAVLEPSTEPVVLEAQSAVQFVYGTAPPHPHDLVLGKYSVHTSNATLVQGERGIAEMRASVRD